MIPFLRKLLMARPGDQGEVVVLGDEEKYETTLPVGYAARSLGGEECEVSIVGGLPGFVIPHVLTASTLMDPEKQGRGLTGKVAEANLQKVRRPPLYRDEYGIPPLSRDDVRGPIGQLRKTDVQAVQEGSDINCLSVQRRMVEGKDSCEIQAEVVQSGVWTRSGVKTLLVWNASEFADCMPSVRSNDVLLIELWMWPALRCLYQCALKPGLPHFDVDHAADMEKYYYQGEAEVPTLTAVYERLWEYPGDLAEHQEHERRVLMTRRIVCRVLAFQEDYRDMFIQLCPLLISRALAAETIAVGVDSPMVLGEWRQKPLMNTIVARKLLQMDQWGRPAPMHHVGCQPVRDGFAGMCALARGQGFEAVPNHPSLLGGQWVLLRWAMKQTLLNEEVKKNPGGPSAEDLLGKMGMETRERNPFFFGSYPEVLARGIWNDLVSGVGDEPEEGVRLGALPGHSPMEQPDAVSAGREW